MTMTLDLPSDVEAQLRHRAAAQGIDPAIFVTRLLRENLGSPSSDAASLPKREAELLQQVDLGFPESFWVRYRELSDALETRELSAHEQAELIAMSDEVEAATARRLQVLIELAKLRGTTLDGVMKQLGIRPGSRHE